MSELRDDKAGANLLYWRRKLEWELARRAHLAAEVEAHERLLEQLQAEIEAAEAAARSQIKSLGIKRN